MMPGPLGMTENPFKNDTKMPNLAGKINNYCTSLDALFDKCAQGIGIQQADKRWLKCCCNHGDCRFKRFFPHPPKHPQYFKKEG